jgi:hypothetical protein
LAFIYLLLLDNENLKAIETSESALPSRSKLTTELVGQVLLKVILCREKEYATTIDEDEKLLRAGNLSKRAAMAIQVRRGEKTVLKEAISTVGSFTGSNRKMRATSQSKALDNKRKLTEPTHQKKKARH